VRNCQFFDVADPIENSSSGALTVENVLFDEVSDSVFSGLVGSTYSIHAVNVTVHHAINLINSSTLTVTNSLFIYVTNWGSAFAGAYNATNTNDSGVFQTAGLAAHYLVTNSPYRDIGTTSINSDLLADIQQLTTYAPQNGGWLDTDPPDLGYHYSTNEDSDYDGLPDWWEWKYFRTFSFSGTNLDALSGSTLLYDYQNGIVPNIPLIPAFLMNTYTQDCWTISASSEQPLVNVYYLLEYDDPTRSWWDPSDYCPQWFEVQAPSNKTVNAYIISLDPNGGVSGGGSCTWIFQGSNDGSTWTNLDTETVLEGDLDTRTLMFNLPCGVNFEYFRVYFTSCYQDAGANIVQVSSFQLIGHQ
jgi:F5/8 type C domain